MRKLYSYLLVGTSLLSLGSFAADQTPLAAPQQAPVIEAQAIQADSVTASDKFIVAFDKNAAAYFKLENTQAADVTLLSVSSDIADKVELHKTVVDEKGVSSMQPTESVLIKAGSSFEFKQGADHVMFVGLKSPLQAGQKVKVTLHFSDNKSQEEEFLVK